MMIHVGVSLCTDRHCKDLPQWLIFFIEVYTTDRLAHIDVKLLHFDL